MKRIPSRLTALFLILLVVTVFSCGTKTQPEQGKKIIVVNVRGGNEEAILSVGPALKAAVPSATVDVYTTEGPWSVLAPEWEKFKGYDAAIFGHNY